MAEFEDGKEESALRTIGEISDALKIKPHVLRYWEQQFSLLSPLKRSGGRRYYRPEDVALVEHIDRLVNQEGYTLRGAEAVLRSQATSDHDRRKTERRSGDRRVLLLDESNSVEATADPDLAPKMQEMIAQIKAIRTRLANAIQA